jgi:hypothetical protein
MNLGGTKIDFSHLYTQKVVGHLLPNKLINYVIAEGSVVSTSCLSLIAVFFYIYHKQVN